MAAPDQGLTTPYDRGFFDSLEEGVLSSAAVIVPLLREIVNIDSVVDLGCGRGAWLKTFAEQGARTIVGYDGDYVDPSTLLIPRNCFHAADLAGDFQIPGTYSLAMSLEVGEHLPPAHARRLVKALCDAAPCVLFSAAVPEQGGTEHVNEQWPAYWRELFRERGFQLTDPIRPAVRDDQRIRWWYRQNVVLYIDEKRIGEVAPSLAAAPEPTFLTSEGIEWVHMKIARRFIQQPTFESAFRDLKHLAIVAIRRRFPKRPKSG